MLKTPTHQPDGEFNRRNETYVTSDIKMDLTKRKEQRVLAVFFSKRKVLEGEEMQSFKPNYLPSLAVFQATTS